MKNIPKLSELEIEIMIVLWKQNKEITIQEISDEMGEKNISPSSVTQAMKRLLKKEAVSIRNYRLVANVYARTFVPNISKEEFTGAELARLEEKLFKNEEKNLAGVMATLLENIANEELDEKSLETLLNETKRKLKAVKEMRKEQK